MTDKVEELEPLEAPFSRREWREWLEATWPLCGCGQPDAVLRLLRDVLRIYRVKRTLDWPQTKARLDALLPTPAVQDQYFYLLAKLHLEEHGGGVPGWLTGLGERVLASLERYGCTLPRREDDDKPPPVPAS